MKTVRDAKKKLCLLLHQPEALSVCRLRQRSKKKQVVCWYTCSCNMLLHIAPVLTPTSSNKCVLRACLHSAMQIVNQLQPTQLHKNNLFRPYTCSHTPTGGTLGSCTQALDWSKQTGPQQKCMLMPHRQDVLLILLYYIIVILYNIIITSQATYPLANSGRHK